MRDIAVTIAVFSTLPFILKRPWIGILVWTWLGFMNPHRLAWGFSTTLPFAMIVALATLVGLLLSKEEKKIAWCPSLVLLLVFWAWMLVTTIVALFPELAWQQLEKVSKILLMIFVAAILINTSERLKALVWVTALSSGFYGVKGGIFTLMTGGGFRVQGPPNTFIGGNNEIGLALVMTAPLLYFLSLTARSAVLRYGLLGAIALTMLAALGTQSRGALLGVGAMAIVLWLKSRRKLQTGALIVFALLVLVPFMPESWVERMATIRNYEQDSSAMTRINSWWMAYNLASNRLPGGGFETFRPSVAALYAPNPREHADAHSIYFEVLGEHGFPGLAIFLSIMVVTWFGAAKVIRRCRGDPSAKWLVDLMAMVQVSLVAYLVSGAFLGLAYFDYFYNLVLIVAIARALTSGLSRNRAATLTEGDLSRLVRFDPVGGTATLSEPAPRQAVK